MGTTTCQACGNGLTGIVPPIGKGPPPTLMSVPPNPVLKTQNSPSSPVHANTTKQFTPSANAAQSANSVPGPLGWCSINGRVIHVEPMYMAMPDFLWGRFLVKLAVIGASVYYLGFVILVALGVLLILAWLASKILPQGLLSGVAVQVISFMLTRRLMGPIANVPVRDIRVRDASSQETLVRMKGQLTAGSVSVGDDLVVEGWDRGGMLLFRRGYNKRIRTDIKIKTQ